MHRDDIPPLITLKIQTLSCGAQCILTVEINHLGSYTLADH